jgi:hypothetical protein
MKSPSNLLIEHRNLVTKHTMEAIQPSSDIIEKFLLTHGFTKGVSGPSYTHWSKGSFGISLYPEKLVGRLTPSTRFEIYTNVDGTRKRMGKGRGLAELERAVGAWITPVTEGSKSWNEHMGINESLTLKFGDEVEILRGIAQGATGFVSAQPDEDGKLSVRVNGKIIEKFIDDVKSTNEGMPLPESTINEGYSYLDAAKSAKESAEVEMDRVFANPRSSQHERDSATEDFENAVDDYKEAVSQVKKRGNRVEESRVAATVAKRKEDHPEDFCKTKKCLYRTKEDYCPKHKPKKVDESYDRESPIVSSVLRRIENTKPEVFDKYGYDIVEDTARDIFGSNFPEEIGSSDVSIWTKQLLDYLESGV